MKKRVYQYFLAGICREETKDTTSKEEMKGTSSFQVACRNCGRFFDGNRVQLHERMCKGGPSASKTDDDMRSKTSADDITPVSSGFRITPEVRQ